MWLVSITLKYIPCTLFTGYLPPRLFKSFKEPIWATETFEISAQQDNGLIRESDAQSFGHKNCGMKSWTNFVEWSFVHNSYKKLHRNLLNLCYYFIFNMIFLKSSKLLTSRLNCIIENKVCNVIRMKNNKVCFFIQSSFILIKLIIIIICILGIIWVSFLASRRRIGP